MTDKQKKQLMGAVAALLVAVAALAAVIIYNKIQSDKEEQAETDSVLMEIEYEDIASVSFNTASGDAITLEHEYVTESADASSDADESYEDAEDESDDESDGESDDEASDDDSESTVEYWYLSSDRSVNIDTDTVSVMVSNLTSLSYEEVVEDAADAAEYGLDDSSNVITITMTDGTEYVITIGSQNAISSDYYIYFGDNETVYTIDSALPSAFEVTLDELISEETESGDE